MSMQTTLARNEAEQAYGQWRDHKQECPKCPRRRERCKLGDEMWDLVQVTRDQLAENRRLDKLPPPGQMTLLPELGAAGPRSFSNGNAGAEEDQWSGWPIRTVHWWHWA